MMILKGLRNSFLNNKILLIFFLVKSFTIYSQEIKDSSSYLVNNNKSDTTLLKKKYTFKLKKDPVKSALLSAAIPGLGQFYNEQYWKIPIAIGIIIWPAYICYDNQVEYNKVRTEYRRRAIGLEREYLKTANDQQLVTYLRTIEKNRDLSFLITLLAYSFNILDAYVSSHLIGFDVENVSFKPNIFYNERTYIGMSIKVNL